MVHGQTALKGWSALASADTASTGLQNTKLQSRSPGRCSLNLTGSPCGSWRLVWDDPAAPERTKRHRMVQLADIVGDLCGRDDVADRGRSVWSSGRHHSVIVEWLLLVRAGQEVARLIR